MHTMINDFDSRKCARVIRQNKYERQSPETFNWWLRLFRMMESEFEIPPYKRKEVVRKIFPDRIFRKIISLMTLVEGEITEQSLPRSVGTIQSAKSGSGATIESIQSKSTPKILDKPTIKREAGPNNPYVRFFKRNPERAAIWRDLPPLSLDQMSLTQKAEAITEAIAVDFINWIKKLGGETTTSLDVAQVMKMFEVGFNTHAATSLEARVKEMPAVTKPVAESRALGEKTIQATLHRKMREDINAFARKRKTLAFNSTLPHELRVVPPKVNPTLRWTKAKTNESLKSMTTVWEGITDLRSTRAFCKWLIAHPELPRPKYLDSIGMLKSSYFDQPHYSIDTQSSDEQSLTIPGRGIIMQKTESK